MATRTPGEKTKVSDIRVSYENSTNKADLSWFFYEIMLYQAT